MARSWATATHPPRWRASACASTRACRSASADLAAEAFYPDWLAIARGDYDHDGDVDADDLAVLEGTLAQGFESAGCVETFDLDGDGALTSCDLALLTELVDGPGAIRCVATGACPSGKDGGCPAGPCGEGSNPGPSYRVAFTP